jgi:hypothetical protein
MIGLERLRYWQGQLLKSRDFQDQLRYDAQLRAWHNAALHQAAGVVSGLQIVNGIVTCGFGYDCVGRELILPKDTPIPPRNGGRVELLVLLPIQPGATSKLAWIDELSWNGNRGLPLARAAEPGGDFDESYGPAPLVRPLARPRLASGETVRGNTSWEIWSEGGAEVGVQTRVDTSAAGFTQKPHYFAALKARQWPLATTEGVQAAEFAPAYFAHVAEATNDGFTFRLLLQDVALRRYEPEQGLGRITSLSRGSGVLIAQVEAGSPFQAGDAVVQVRPRAEAGAMIESTEGTTLTLASELTFRPNDRLVLGNLPRTAEVREVTQESDVLVLLSASGGAVAGSILARLESEAAPANASRIARIREGKLLLRDPWPGLAEGDRIHMFHRKDAIKIRDARADGNATVITVPSDAGFRDGDAVLHLTSKRPAPPSQITGVEVRDDEVRVTLTPAIAELKAGSNVVPSRLELTVAEVDTPVGSLEIHLMDDSPFIEQDLVKPAGSPGPIAIVEFADGPVVRLSAPAAWTTAGDTLVAANFTGALTVENTRIQGGSTVVTVARPAAVRTGYAVARLESDGTLSSPAMATTIPGGEFRIDPSIPGLARFQTLVVIQFPAVVRLASIVTETQVRIDPAGGIAAGDWLAPIDPVETFPIVQVTAVNADGTLRLSRAIGVAVDTMLGQVHFRDAAVVESFDPTSKEVETKRALAVTAGSDFAGLWVYDEDNSSTAKIDAVNGDRLTLRPIEPNGLAGEGLIQSGEFDAGLLAYGSVSPQQKRLVLTEPPGLAVNDSVTFSGTNSLGAVITVPMTVESVSGARLELAPTLGIAYALRPERSTLVSRFNANFPTSFAVFAQRRGLYVAWLGCQPEPRTYPECGGGKKEDPCP